MLKPEFTTQFKKDYKKAISRGLKSEKLEYIVKLLCEEKQLPKANKDHLLVNSRDFKNMRECHIEPDWLLVYQIVKENLILKLIRTGSHSDLF